MKSYLLAGAACILLAGSASAADLAKSYPVKAPVMVVPAFTWTGFYIGAHAGYGWADADVDYDYFGGIPSLDADGWFGGAQLGYNYQFANNVVLGAEADISFGDINDDQSLGGSAYVSGKIDYFGTARLRLGYAFDRFMPYVTGGLAWAHVKGEWGYYDYSVEDKNTSIGWTVGGGVEYAFTDHWTAKIEYLYADLGSDDYSFGSGDLYSADVDLTTQLVRIGVNYKF